MFTKTSYRPRTTTLVSLALAAACLLLALVGPALAQSSDWVQPGIGLLEALESGLVKIGAIAVGIAIIVLGLLACFTQRMEWNKFGFILIGGLMVMAGPAMLRMLLSMAG